MNKILLSALLLSITFFSYSQNVDSTAIKTPKKKVPMFKGVKYGVRGGLNISNLDFKEHPEVPNKHRNSIYFGAFAEIALSNKLAISPELQFSAEGANEETLHLDYIQMPILMNVSITEKVSIGLGPQVSLKVHKYEDGIKNFAYSGVGGVTYKINYALFADVRYTYGISNIFDDKLSTEARNTNIQIGIGYKF
ncbi:porin family protein [Neotamlana laminarinivorans]|uniref:PorT family protein n=1 Tax=Neotamlana laminarinivorans TaxID=2883124 RepID=A0A9X1I0L6_9FLAO|nr:porin family protein [Tamlana laminarinivorans]MCB4797814.1 PorT family protein [Tamlana laminarinivorans]